MLLSIFTLKYKGFKILIFKDYSFCSPAFWAKSLILSLKFIFELKVQIEYFMLKNCWARTINMDFRVLKFYILCAHLYTYIFIYICMYIYIYIYVHMYINIWMCRNIKVKMSLKLNFYSKFLNKKYTLSFKYLLKSHHKRVCNSVKTN